MEHNVYICSWASTEDGFELWVTSRPHIRGRGATYEEAEKNLVDAIQNAGGAMQAVLEFDPPLAGAATEARYRTPALRLIVGDDRFETDAPPRPSWETPEELDERLRWNDAFYARPLCRACRSASSRRSTRPLPLSYAPARYDSAFGHVGLDGPTLHQIFSEEFLALLTSEEKSGLELIRVVGKKRRPFFELVGPEGPSMVAVPSFDLRGWRCGTCDYRCWSHFKPGSDMRRFIARSDLTPSPRGVFTVGRYPEIALVATAERWRELVGRKGTRGMISQALGVADEPALVRAPDLPVREGTTG